MESPTPPPHSSDHSSRSSTIESGFEVGPWRVEPSSNSIYRGERKKHLENRQMRTLVLLAEHHGQVVSRKRFIETVWRERVVNDEALSRAISLLRTALGDDAKTPEFIQTIPGVGYRLVAPVKIIEAAAGETPPASDPVENSIAVLPFVNISDDASNEYFSDGVSEEILNALTQVDGFHVVGRTSSFAFKNRNEDLRKIGRALNASHVLEGSVRKSDQRVRVTAQLIKVSDGYHAWSGSFDRDLEDIFAAQDEIAAAVTGALTSRLLETFNKSRETGPEAYSRYLQGLHFVRSGTISDVQKALELFQQVVNLDPEYAPAWAGITEAYWYLISYGAIKNRGEAIRAARQANQRALALDDRLAEAHAGKALLIANFDQDWTAARQALNHARAVAPGNTRILAQSGQLASSVGDFEASVEQLRRVVVLDPLFTTGHIWLSLSLIALRRFDEARGTVLQALNVNPNRSILHMILSKILLLQGDFAASLEQAQQEPDAFWRQYALAACLYSLKRRDEADRVFQTMIDSYSDVGPFQIAELHAWRREPDEAFRWLECARKVRDNGLIELLVSPYLAALHADPRWTVIARKLGHRWPRDVA